MGSTPVECTNFKPLQTNGLQKKTRPKARALLRGGLHSAWIGGGQRITLIELHSQRISLYASCMSAFSAVLAPSSDGTLHVPIPENWIKQGVTAVLIKADIEPLGDINLNPEQNKALKGFGCLRGKISLAPDFDEPIAGFKEYSA